MALTVQEFAGKIKQKYPEYQGMDDKTLSEKIVNKYPEYKDKVDFGGDYFGKGLVDFGKSTALGLGNFGAQAAAETARFGGNALNAVGQIVDPVTNINRVAQTVDRIGGGSGENNIIPKELQVVEGLTGQAKKATDYLADTAEKTSQFTSGKGEDDISTWGGRGLGFVAGTIGSMAVTPQVQIAKLKALSPFLGKIIPQSLVNTAVQAGGIKGEAPNWQDYATGAAFDSALYGGGKLLRMLSKKGLASIPNFTNIQKGRMAEQGLTMDKIGESLYDIDIPVTNDREVIKAAIANKVAKLSGVLDEAIDAADNTPGLVPRGQGGAVRAADLIDDLKGKTLDELGNLKFGQAQQVSNSIDNVLDEFKNTVGSREYLTNAETQALKKNLGGALESFYNSNAQEKALDVANDVIRGNAQEIIEKNVPVAAGLNAEMSPLLQVQSRLAKAGRSGGYLGRLIAGSAGAAGDLARGNLVGAGKNAATAIGIKELLTSDLSKTALANFAKSTERGALSKIGEITNPILRTLIFKGLSGQ
jgi:hypothetical protein